MGSTLAISTAAVAAAALCAGLLGTAPAGADPGHSSHPVAPPVTVRAAGATILGQTGGVPAVCTSTPTVPAAVLLASEGANASSYIATTDGVLTSFTHVSGSSVGQVRAIVFADTATGSRKLVAAKSPLVTVKRSASNTFLVRLPIKVGQRLGLGYTTKQTVCLNQGVPGDTASFASPFDPDTTSDFLTSGSFTGAYRPNISAVLEPDVDGDAFGDISQDACPESALSQVACPAPDTIVTKKPKRRTGRNRIKLKFAASVVDASFQCSRDGHKFKTCHSPYKRRFGPGKHRVFVRAVSAVGIPDATPVKVKFRIR